ncbi:MAG: acyl-CoA dehydrogenase [Betaproteobacteria bacterium]|nr:acyl-CoA dehydrogenase [Betaproteobacteria bacterium]
MNNPSCLIDARELSFQLYDVLDVETLTRRAWFADHDRTTFDSALEMARKLAEERFRPHHRKSDLEEPRVVDGRVRLIPEIAAAINDFASSGLLAAHHGYAAGGMQLPWVVAQACYAHFHAANVATFAYCFLTIAAANLLDAFGSAEQKQRYMRPMLSGRFLGTMCLSEPQAGSSLADIRTRATPLGGSRYRITGSKMWISGGEHELSENIVHLVLARTDGAPPGVKGISLFLVTRRRLRPDGGPGELNDVVLGGLNHKMGYRGTINTALNFGERGDCIGELVGEPHRGLAYMFHMMNEARIVVGMSAAALGLAGFRVSLDYARQRPQGRLPQAKDPSAPPVMIIKHADVRRLLLEQKAYAEGALALGLYCARLLDEQKTVEETSARERAGALLDVLTPIMKAWSSEWCLRANSNAIQVLGGYGYTRDFPVEQYYRDNRLNPIHEGTNGIQAIDLLGRKASMNDGQAVRTVATTMRVDIEAANALSAVAAHAAQLDRALALLQDTTATVAAARARLGDALPLSNATSYLDLFGHVVIAWMWLRQATAAATRIQNGAPGLRDFYLGKLHTARFFFRHELPRVEHCAKLVAGLDDTCLTMQDTWF